MGERTNFGKLKAVIETPEQGGLHSKFLLPVVYEINGKAEVI